MVGCISNWWSPFSFNTVCFRPLVVSGGHTHTHTSDKTAAAHTAAPDAKLEPYHHYGPHIELHWPKGEHRQNNHRIIVKGQMLNPLRSHIAKENNPFICNV